MPDVEVHLRGAQRERRQADDWHYLLDNAQHEQAEPLKSSACDGMRGQSRSYMCAWASIRARARARACV
eukprot:2210416-Pleurochrysis_carterae.AAC.5